MKTIIAAAVLSMTLTPLCRAADMHIQDPAGIDSAVADEKKTVEQPMDDAALAAFLKAANDTEVEAAKQALEKARSRAVKSYARQMIRTHNKNNEEVASAVKTLGITPQETPLSRSVREDAEKQTTTISSRSGPDFDSAYIESEVAAHQAVLSHLERALGGGENRPEQFATLLQKTRDAVIKHLEQADKLKEELKERR